MKRVALLIQYDGSNYSGWQRQKNAPTVQETLERALFKITNYTVKTFAAGRTDAGVQGCGCGPTPGWGSRNPLRGGRPAQSGCTSPGASAGAGRVWLGLQRGTGSEAKSPAALLCTSGFRFPRQAGEGSTGTLVTSEQS